MDSPVVPNDASSAPQEPQFRTYARDVAALTGTAPTQITNTPAPAPKPKAPAEPPPAPIIPKAPTTEESREAVLARLKQRATPKEPAPREAPATPIKPPPTQESREEVLRRLKEKAVAVGTAPRTSTQPSFETPVGVPKITKEPVASPAPIHTYTSDFREKATTERATPLSILAQEQDAQGTTSAPTVLKSPKKNYLPLALGALALICAGVASVYVAVSFVTGRPPVIGMPVVPSLVFSDMQRELKGSGEELQQGLIDLTREPLSEGQVAVAYITYASTTAKNTTIYIPAEGGALISSMNLSAPDILLRNIGQESTVGVIKANDETYPFFLLRVTSYERTFAGMLSWEETIQRDMVRFYPPRPLDSMTSGTSTASSTLQEPRFKDAVVVNQDVRVLKDALGRSLLVYGYKDKQTLIIARDEKAFSELLRRLSATHSN